jgi:hypothetical protein
MAHDRHERRTGFVVLLTAAMMIAEIIGRHSVVDALVADGWHMSTALWLSERSPIGMRARMFMTRVFRLAPARWESWRDSRAPSFWRSSPCSSVTSRMPVSAPVPISFNQAIAIAVVAWA